MDWNALNLMAQGLFGPQRINAPKLLVAWAENDFNGELQDIIEPHGLHLDSLSAAMRTLIEEGDTDDEKLMTESILRSRVARPTGRHLLETICAHPEHRVTQALTNAGLNVQSLRHALEHQHEEQQPVNELARFGISLDIEAAPLMKYGRDLTSLAREGCFDGYCNRPSELDSVATILMRMERGNPALTGEAGVGKTALIEILAREIVKERIGIPPGTRIFEINIGKLVAGTHYRGEFEKRVDEVVQAVLKSAPAFLFLDEAHLLFGTGRAEGAPMDMANFLKPFLSRGDLRVIAATTANEFNRYIASDEALARRFEEIRVPPPNPELTGRMVRARAHAIAAHHGIEISDVIVGCAIDLSNEHFPQKLQPYKSIDLLDTAAARARRLDRRAIDEDILLHVLAASLGRDVAELKGARREILRGLSERLKARIVGQDQAIDKVVATLTLQLQKMGSNDRNQGVFLFVGPTGVGKTELARQLSKCLYGTNSALLHLDMSEYVDTGSINKLIGPPPGYIGSEQEGTLICWLQNHPAGGILLFDEIEKAHREIHNLLLGLLDNGRIHNIRGKTINCRHCAVILTSNALSTEDLKRGPMGFGGTKAELDPGKLLTKDFPGEFLGRLDHIILFNKLALADIERIAMLRLVEATQRLEKRRVYLRVDMRRLARHLAIKLGTSSSGARRIERVIEQFVLEPISQAALQINYEGALDAVIGEAFYEKGEVEVFANNVSE